MRLGPKRHIYFRTNRGSRKSVSGFLLILLVLSMVFTGGVYFLRMARPMLISLADNQAKIVGEQAVHKAVQELFDDTSYTDFVTLSRLEDGTISAIESNMTAVNRLKSEVTIQIQEALAGIGQMEVSVPLGDIIGISLFSDAGPSLPVRLMPYGRISVDFTSEFKESGINQTRLEISLTAKAYIHVIMPTARICSEIETEIPVVQTVIVGKIPENYVNIDRTGENFENDVLSLIN